MADNTSSYVDFLQSDMMELCSSSSSRSFKIHRKLLDAKCRTPSLAIRSNFQEGLSRRYTFTDTADMTIAQFIEWAYKGDYSEPLPTSTECKIEGSVNVEEQAKGGPELDQSQSPPDIPNKDVALQAHTLLSHLQVYIFSEVYMIQQLKELAFQKLTATLVEMRKPKNLDESMAIVDCLILAFSKVPVHDELLEWLAQYAAWCLENLRQTSQFHDALAECPALGSRMMKTLNPAGQAPWERKHEKYRVPSYSARMESDYPIEE